MQLFVYPKFTTVTAVQGKKITRLSILRSENPKLSSINMVNLETVDRWLLVWCFSVFLVYWDQVFY
ncbi:MAG: hypothetical protein CR996_00510 [Draconibacterium sp.]|nr:MAG: hypothetical protein CR996_00510 [Draconibacterium sp.]